MADRLIPLGEARRQVLEGVAALDSEPVALDAALGRVLAQDVVAAGDVPGFANSAMDGYAVRSGPADRTLAVAGESRAGAPFGGTLEAGGAVRISTGAAMPDGVDAVVPVEQVREGDGIVHLDAASRPGDHVRGRGEDLRAGAVALAAPQRLGPAQLGVAAVAGAARVVCAARPRVSLVVTGDELVAPGARLGPGQVHDANGVTVAALVRRTGAQLASCGHASDEPRATRRALEQALDEADLVVVCGGVSVGAHDHVRPALADLGVGERFWGVALKPGKPTWFGSRAGQPVFGLPGNPVSAMVTFLLLVDPALRALQGLRSPAALRTALLGERVARHPSRTQALRVRLDQRDTQLLATPTGAQGSHVLSSMAGADGLALVAPGSGHVAAGEPVTVELV